MWAHLPGTNEAFERRVAEWAAGFSPSGQAIPLVLRGDEGTAVLAGVVAALFPEAGSAVLPAGQVAPLVLRLRELGLIREYQARAVLLALSAPYGRGILDIAMGGGKTLLAISLAAVAAALGRPRWLYLVQNRELADQTLRALGKDSGPILEALGGPALDFQATTYAGVKKLDSRRFDGVLVDECHALAPPTRCLPYAMVKAHWHIGMSGTPLDRQDEKNALTIGLLGPVLLSIDVAKLEEEGFLARGKVKVVRYSRRARGVVGGGEMG